MLLEWGVLFSNCLNLCMGSGRRWSWPRSGCRRVGWVVPTVTLTPRGPMRADRELRCCWRKVSAMSRGRELKLAAGVCLDSRLPICFLQVFALRSLSSVIKSYMTSASVWGDGEVRDGRQQVITGGICDEKNEILCQMTVERPLLGPASTSAASALAKDGEAALLSKTWRLLAQCFLCCSCFITKTMHITYKNTY